MVKANSMKKVYEEPAYSTLADGPGPEIADTPGQPCPLCGKQHGSLRIHFPPFKFTSGDFEAPLWWSHEKYYCPQCRFLWSDWLNGRSLEEYGKVYVKANYEHQRLPAEPRMLAAPHLLRRLLVLTGGRRFLDYGVGYNIPYIYELRGRGLDVWGCDISSAVPYSRFIRYLPDNDLPEGTFHGIYSLDVAEHFADIVSDYLRIARLLRPQGMVLHSTYWLHRLWDGTPPFPRNPVLWNPWHVSLCSERTMQVIAKLAGLEYAGTIRLPTDTGQGYILRKPGGGCKRIKRLAYWCQPRFWQYICQLNGHMRYIRRSYDMGISR